jgi:hypothetical protein
MNAHCILENIKILDAQTSIKAKKLALSPFFIEIISEPNIVDTSKQRLSLSKNYVDKGLYSYGRWDPHFTAFVAHRFTFTPLVFYFAFCNKALDISLKYAEIF